MKKSLEISFVANNMVGDNTYMKEYVSYELMQEIDVDASLFGFADIKVNGEGWGLYLALETFRALGNLRYQSIRGQLDGTIPSTTAEQTTSGTSISESLLIYSGLFALVLILIFSVAKNKRNY